MSELSSVLKARTIYESSVDEDRASFIGARLARDIKNLKRLEEFLSDVEGQAHAVEALKGALFGIRHKENTSGPLACITLIGHTASGKDLCAERAMLALGIPYKRFDMGTYSSKDANVSFNGTDYVFKNHHPGQVTEFVDDHPFCGVILEGIENAHSTIHDLIQQILEKGELEDLSMKKSVNFRNVILIITTNLGSSVYNGNFGRYNLSEVPQSTIVKELRAEIDPRTDAPALTSTLVSRMAAGKIILFNKLRPESIHKILKKAILKEVESYKSSYHIDIEIDADELARIMIFSLGESGDVRSLLEEGRSFLKKNFLGAVDTAIKRDGCFTKLRYVFDNAGASEDVHRLFEGKTGARIAVFCPDEQRATIKKSVGNMAEVFFIPTGASLGDVLDIDASSILISIDGDEMAARRIFRELGAQDDIPIYVFSAKGSDTLPFSHYKTRGATDCFSPSAGGDTAEDWISSIARGMKLSSVTQELFRSSKVLNYDVTTSLAKNGHTAEITVGNYTLSAAMNAADAGSFASKKSMPNVSFDDIIGAEEAKKELKTVIESLKSFRQLRRDGVRVPRGALLEGNPGTGKTMLAKAVATSCGVPFIELNGSELIQSLVGNGAKMLRDLFEYARNNSPSILFIDEIDAIAGNRNSIVGYRTDDILNALLSEMDGFNDYGNRPVFVIAATNFSTDREDTKLDPAFLRRFDRIIYIDLPNRKQRQEYITKRLGEYRASEVSERCISSIAKRSVGLSLSDLNLVIENAKRSCYFNSTAEALTDAILTQAYEDYLDGGANEQSERELEQIARHEAGHAVVAHALGLNPTYTTIVSRRSFGGYVSFSNEGIGSYSKSYMLNKICCAYAGRASEVMYYEENGLTSGIRQDIKHATQLAELMVTEYAMWGDIMYIPPERRAGSDDVQQKVREILDEQYARADRIIRENMEGMELLTRALLEKNSLDEEEITLILTKGDENGLQRDI